MPRLIDVTADRRFLLRLRRSTARIPEPLRRPFRNKETRSVRMGRRAPLVYHEGRVHARRMPMSFTVRPAAAAEAPRVSAAAPHRRPRQPEQRPPTFALDEPPWHQKPRYHPRPPTLGPETSMASSLAARRAASPRLASPTRPSPGPSRSRPWTVDWSRRRLPRVDGGPEQQIGCCHVCATNAWTWRGQCSCGGTAQAGVRWHAKRTLAPPSVTAEWSGVAHVTAWIPRTAPIPAPPPQQEVPLQASVVTLDDESSKGWSKEEQDAIEWAEDRQWKVEEEKVEAAAAAARETQERAIQEAAAETAAAAAAALAAEKEPRNQAGRTSERRLTRQMTLAHTWTDADNPRERSMSMDANNPNVKTLSDVQDTGTTAWVGGLPHELALDKGTLHELLATHGGDLQAVTIRLKPLELGETKSWCFATYLLRAKSVPNSSVILCDSLILTVLGVATQTRTPSPTSSKPSPQPLQPPQEQINRAVALALD